MHNRKNTTIVTVIFILTLLTSSAWARQQDMQDMDHMQMSHTEGPAIQAKIISERRQSEFNHHLAGFLLLLAGAFFLMQGQVAARLPQLKYAWPSCFMAAGVFVLVFSDPELWPFGPQSWLDGITTDLEVLQHKVFAAILLTLGVVETLRIRGIFTGAWSAWIFPMFAIAGAILLLLHRHEAGMHDMAVMERIQLQHRWYALLGFLIAVTKLLAETTRKRAIFSKIWPALIITLGASLMLYTESA